MGNALMADRYIYIASIGFFLLLGLGYEKLAGGTVSKIILTGSIAAYALFCGYLTFDRTLVWKDSVTLWSDAIEKQPRAAIAWKNRAAAYDELAEAADAQRDPEKYAGYKQQAIADYTRAIGLNYLPGYFLRGAAKLACGKTLHDRSMLQSALQDLDAAVAIDIDHMKSFPRRLFTYRFSEVLLARGECYLELGSIEKACGDFQEAAGLQDAAALQKLTTYCGTARKAPLRQ